jgi:hypothetical protein
MSIRTHRLRTLAFARRLDIAALAATLASLGGWLMFWFGD